MTATVGVVATWAAIATLVAAGGLAATGRDAPALRLHRLGAGLAAVAVGAVGWALATGDFTLAYVAAVSDRSTSWPYRVAGIWGGMGGSLLLWAALVAIWGIRRRPIGSERAALALLAAAVLLIDATCATPFHRLAAPAIDGLGATPILRHPAMLYHPPILYLGLTGLVVPWAAVVGVGVGAPAVEGVGVGAPAVEGVGVGAPAVEGGGADARVRRSLLLCLGLLTVGMVAGAHWAYVELGWGGYWAWDPVENTALLPWLATIGALHGLVARRRHGRPGRAASVLATTALVLAMGGTLLTRSGAAPSVHAFGEDRAVGWALLAVLLAVVAATLVALLRRPMPVPAIDPVRGRGGEALAVAAQPWLAGFAVAVVLLGTVRPLVGDDAVAVDGSYYATLLAPAGLVAVVLLLRFRPTQLAHVGVLVLAIGLAGSTRSASGSATLAEGESLRVQGWEVRNDGVRLEGDRTVVVDLAVSRGGDERTHLEPSLVAFPDRGVLLPETSLRSTPLADVQVALRDADDDGRALVEVHVRPLVWFVWWGGLLIGASAICSAGAGGGMWAARIPGRE